MILGMHSDIIASINSLFFPGNDHGNPETIRDLSSNMPLLEKMTMWDRKYDDSSHLERLPDECFEGVPEIEDDEPAPPDNESYKALVLKNPLYNWLVSTLSRELSSIPATLFEPALAKTSIKSWLLMNLPSGEVSRHRSPLVFEVTFALPWHLFLPNDQQELPQNTDGSGTLLAAIGIACTGNPEVLHTGFALDYMRTTWPYSGERMIRLLDHLVTAYKNNERRSGLWIKPRVSCKLPIQNPPPS